MLECNVFLLGFPLFKVWHRLSSSSTARSGMASDEIEKEEGGGSHEIPDEVRAAIDTLLDSGEPLRVAVETDITLSGKYGSTWLLATDRRLMSLTPNGHEGPHLVEVPLNRVTGVDLRETFGCGTLKVRTERDGTTLALFSKSQLQAVSDAAAQIEDLVNASQPERDDGRILRSTLHKAAVRRKRCDACGNVIPTGCAACVPLAWTSASCSPAFSVTPNPIGSLRPPAYSFSWLRRSSV